MAGTIGLTENERIERDGYLKRKMGAQLGETDEKGKPYTPLPPGYSKKLDELNKKDAERSLPKTMQTELRKIHRMETYRRNFPFTNKYVQKGIQQEEEAITTYQMYLKKVKGITTLLTKNTERLKNDWFSGEPDVGPIGVPIREWKEGWDTKCSWDLSTFPFPKDELDPQYESQNQVYMDLTGARKWTTVYCLVNGTEHQVNNEKLKYFYAYNQPDEENNPTEYALYLQKVREVELMMIFDYDRFIDKFPYHDMNISKDEWHGEGYDIPLEERVIEKVSIYNPEFITELKGRCTIGREYLNKL